MNGNKFKQQLFEQLEFKNNQILEEENPILNSYLTQSYFIINEILRNELSTDRFQLLELLEKEFSTIDKFTGKIVYRCDTGIYSNKFFLENMGKVICFPCILSCYRNKSNMSIQEFGEDDFYFKILLNQSNTNAYDTKSQKNYNSREDEVAFSPNTNFKIINIQNQCIQLQETLEKANFHLFQNSDPYYQKSIFNNNLFADEI